MPVIHMFLASDETFAHQGVNMAWSGKALVVGCWEGLEAMAVRGDHHRPNRDAGKSCFTKSGGHAARDRLPGRRWGSRSCVVSHSLALH